MRLSLTDSKSTKAKTDSENAKADTLIEGVDDLWVYIGGGVALAALSGGGGGAATPPNDGAAAFGISVDENKALIAMVQSADPDGNGTFSYKWEKTADTISGTETLADLTGWSEASTSASYTPQSTDSYVRLAEVTYTDGDGFSESVTPSDNVFKVHLNTTTDGGAGRDYITIGAGVDYFIRAGAGDDIIYGTSGSDFIQGSAGNDIIFGFGGSDNLQGSQGNDTVYGGDGNDGVQGEAGNDTLYGEAGNDILLGSAGTNMVTGGAGDDLFQLELADGLRGKDIITDFKANGDSDTLRFNIDNSLLASVTSTDTITSVAGIGWTNDSNDSGTSANDTIISYLGADKAVGGTGDNADEIIGVLVDYSTELVFTDFVFF